MEQLAPIDHLPLAEWITAISFDDWPQQHHRSDLPQRPAMVSDFAWHGFGGMIAPVISELMLLFPGRRADTHLLSVVMPGQDIEPHTDSQPPNWVCRVHVPILSNKQSRFIVGGIKHFMCPGMAYKVNTEAVHSVENDGDAPRIHLMWDVKTQ